MHTIRMPKATKTMDDGTVVQWYKQEGSPVETGEPLLAIETVDSGVEVASGVSGTLRKILLPAGASAPVESPIALIGKEKAKIDKALKAAEKDIAEVAEAWDKARAEATAPAPVAKKTTPRGKPAAAPVDKPEAPAPVEKKAEEEKPVEKDVPAAAPGGPVVPILMPQAGQSMEEGTIVAWRVQPGDAVAVGQIIFDVETDKATVEVEAVDAGRLAKIVVAEGETIEVKKPVAYIADNDADVDAVLAAAGGAEETTPRGKPVAAPAAMPPTPAPVAQVPAPPEGSVVPILMPQAGQSMEEGTIVTWRVQPGDAVEVGQIIFDVETDKATVEVEAVDAGRLAKIVVAEGDTIEVKKDVAYLADDDADVEAYLASQAAATPVAEAVTAEATPRGKPVAAPAAPSAPAVVEGGRVKASPAARKAAVQMGIDLRTVGRGSGPGGRILSTDVESATAVASGPVRYKMTGMRKAIARNLSYSKQHIPHFYARLTIDAEAMFAFYRGEKAKYACTLNDVVTLACGRAIRELPAFRSQIEDDEIVEYPSANIGIAVGVEDGLVVPVVMGVDRMSLQQLGVEARRLIDNAREGKLENMGQGVFTITNLGMFGVEEFSAIINPPEAAILAVSALREDVVVRDGAMRPGKVMTMTLSTDHRIIDGVVAAQFLARLKELLEDPAQLA